LKNIDRPTLSQVKSEKTSLKGYYMPNARSNSIKKQIAATRRSLKSLDRSLNRLAAMAALEGKDGTRRRTRLSAKVRASLKLQGRYMGYMRQLNQKQKAQVRKIRETKGMKVAIQKAKGLAKG
jgi:hypothetical protein